MPPLHLAATLLLAVITILLLIRRFRRIAPDIPAYDTTDIVLLLLIPAVLLSATLSTLPVFLSVHLEGLDCGRAWFAAQLYTISRFSLATFFSLLLFCIASLLQALLRRRKNRPTL